MPTASTSRPSGVAPARSRGGRGVPSDKRIRRRRVVSVLVGGVAGLLVAGVAVVATAPKWGASRVERELEDRLSRRLGLEVEIGGIDMNWRRVELEDVALDGPGLDMNLDRVTVTLDRGELRSARFVVTAIHAEGGHVEAERAAIEDLADRLGDLAGERPDPRSQSWLRRRTRLTPNTLEVHALSFGIDDRDRRATGSVEASVDPASKRVDVEVADLIAELGLGTPLRASSVATHLELGDEGLTFPIEVEVEGASAQVDDNIAVAGVHGSIAAVDRDLSAIEVDLAGGFAEVPRDGEPVARRQPAPADADTSKLWSIAGSFARDFSQGTIAVDMEAFELGRVPEVLARLPLVESERATVGGHLELDFAAGVAELNGQLAIAGLNVSHDLLAREVVRDVGFTVDIDAELDPAARRLTIENMTLGRDGVELTGKGEIIHAAERAERRYQVEMAIPRVACQDVLDAIPRELVPGLQGFRLTGDFGATLEIEADFADLDNLRLEGNVDMDGCRVVEAPALASADRLGRGFRHRVTMRDGRTRTVRLYPGSGSYTPLASISRYMTEAVLTTEDGSFRRHDGFNTSQLEAALRRNLKAGKVRLGASTITMQMVKNVLLSHERTLSRKLQELFLTWWVEQALSKQRIMELYLNVVEFGPGVYGVTNAARHYYGKHPSELTTKEAAYLALMLPSPVRRHVHYCNGELSERFVNKLAWIHGLMLERERITQEEHDVYSQIPLAFDLLERGDPDACRAEIDTIMAGTHTQRALSGLLGDRDPQAPAVEPGDWPDGTTSTSWGVRPPLPLDLPYDLYGGIPGQPDGSVDPDAPGEPGGRRLAPGDVDWRTPAQPIDRDPANSDAPGRPAMDELG